ncbi:methyl-accepting chemotaxis protein [Neobacillus niacini]|uniref:methyl-accepting chemotaxis protein n=1 Tax=Neobacillus niacini TaxID=86668 RepID=UPI00285E78CA|nr:methyl-accepting chemotaxis protein [Neobacillus niacini]MDR7000219.1 methyl-accepting chemotaxis protein [Neobacillus niacini]
MRITIGKKLFFSFVAVLMILSVSVAMSYSQITSVDKSYSNLFNDKVQKLIMIQKMNVAIKQEQVELRGYLIAGNDEANERYMKAHDDYLKLSKSLDKIINNSKAKELLNELNQIENEYFHFGNKEIQLKQENKSEEYTKLIKEQGLEIIKRFDHKIEELVTFQQSLLDNGNQDNTSKVESVKKWVLVIGIVSIVIGMIIALIIGRIISTPLVKMAKMAEKIASGNLTFDEIKMKNKDEIGDLANSFNQMTNNLRHLIQEVGANAEQVAASAEQLSASAEETSAASIQIGETMHRVADGVNRQVQSIEETSLTINELSVGVQQIANNSLNVSNSSVKASEKALDGGKAIQTAILQMNSISKTVTGLSEVVESLGKRSNEIGKIIEVITGIAAQTNLLSLNAAIEAARAGEHGRGFAVVADEVRKLAEQSAQSAEQISQLISTIQEETTKTVQSMEIATNEVSTGIEIVNSAGNSFEEITGAIDEVTSQIQEVSAAVQEIAAGSEQMAQSVKLITEVSESTAAGTHEVAAATQQQSVSMKEVTKSANYLSTMAEELQKLIGRFTI